MHSILVFVALASAMPIATEPNVVPQNTADSSRFLSKRIATAAVDLVQRSVCDSAADDASASDCPHVNSVLRAALALFFLFAFLVLLHVWQAAQYNTIRKMFLSCSLVSKTLTGDDPQSPSLGRTSPTTRGISTTKHHVFYWTSLTQLEDD